MVAGPDAPLSKNVREPVGPLVQLAIREPDVPGDEREAVGNRIDDELEEIREVVGQRARHEQVL